MRARDPTRTAVGRLHDNLEEKVVAVLVHNADWKTELKLDIQKALHTKGGSVVAEKPIGLMVALGLRGVSRCRFKAALGSLMYKDRVVICVNVDGHQHYQLLGYRESAEDGACA